MFSVAPDSFAPLKHTSAMNIIFWLALIIFISENVLIMFFQYFAENLSKITIINISGITTTMINRIFTMGVFPLLYIQLIKPFFPILYSIFFILILVYTGSGTFINSALSLVTKQRLNI
tara:strand:+ start:27 stop:383 length:357 start_codon:yes stop_codon:yes gene_type:complete